MNESINKRGRPSTGKALTPSQKQKAYRLRLANKPDQFSDFENLFNKRIDESISQSKELMQFYRAENGINCSISQKFFHDMQALIEFKNKMLAKD
jgi:hypothetical protein